MTVFVILNYMTTLETEKLVKNILNLNGEKRVIVVDNASPNASGFELQNYFDKSKLVDVILAEENGGFAKGNNIGYKAALKYSPKFIVVLNSDIEITQEDLIDKISEIYNSTKFAIMGPDIVVPETGINQNPKRKNLYTKKQLEKKKETLEKKLRNEKRLRLRSFFKQFNFLRKVYLRTFQINKKSSISITSEVDILHGAFIVFSKKFMNAFIEPFDDRTFFYFEMEILGIRTKRENLISIYTPKIKVLHHQNLSTKKAFQGEYKKTVFQISNMIKSINICLKYY